MSDKNTPEFDAGTGAQTRREALAGLAGRWGVVVPAAAITFGLFLAMDALISPVFEEPEINEQRILTVITPQRTVDETPRTRQKPTRIAEAVKPPPPPEISMRKDDIDLPGPVIQGEAPKEINFDRMRDISVPPIAINERDAKPISPPQISYPNRAAERGIEGTCNVRFDVSVRGEPYNVQASCTDSVFRREAERAVERVRFAPKIVRGQATERANVVYPVVFELEGEG